MTIYLKDLGDPIVCDMTFPRAPSGALETPDFDGAMEERRQCGVTFTSLTIASDEASISDPMRWIASARKHLLSQPDKYLFVEKAEDIRIAKDRNLLAVNFHFQGTNPLLGNLDLVEPYRRLGVGHMLLAYNSRNLAGDGCHETTDGGLSRFGKALVEQMNRVGMLVDLSHTGYRTSMEAIDASSEPVIFSHSNAKAVFDHARNITDHQVKACAATGGVIGVNGVGLFLSAARHDSSAEAIARHAQHFADLVGPEHVGIGLDSVHDVEFFLQNFARKNRDRYPSGGYLTSNTPAFARPSVIPTLADVLARSGWSSKDVRGFLGENWLRVLSTVW